MKPLFLLIVISLSFHNLYGANKELGKAIVKTKEIRETLISRNSYDDVNYRGSMATIGENGEMTGRKIQTVQDGNNIVKLVYIQDL